jgi:hypothetical protein
MRTLNRPMFRIGGSAGTGITSGLAPRQGYQDAGMVTDYDEKLKMLRGVRMPRDRSLSNFMIDFGLGMVGTPPTGNILQTAAQVGRAPFESYKKAQEQRAAYDQQLGMAAATSAMTQSDKMKQIAAAAMYKDQKDPMEEMKALAAEYLEDYAGDYNLAMNKAKFFLEIRPQLASSFGESQVGGIIDQGELADEKAQKKWMKRNGNKLGQIFYDINDGQVKKLIQQPGTLTLGFEVVDLGGMSQAAVANMETDLPAVEEDFIPKIGINRVASTGMSDAQAEKEAAKRGLTLLTKPEGAERGWLNQAKQKNPQGVTKQELEEIMRQELFSEQTDRLYDKKKLR